MNGDSAELKLGFEYRNCVRRQVEFYFSTANLRRDKYFHDVICESPGGWVPLQAVIQCSRMRKLRVTEADVLLALRGSKLECRTTEPAAEKETADPKAPESDASPAGADEADEKKPAKASDGEDGAETKAGSNDEDAKTDDGSDDDGAEQKMVDDRDGDSDALDDVPPPPGGTYIRRRDRRLPQLSPRYAAQQDAQAKCDFADGNDAREVESDGEDEVLLDYPLIREAEIRAPSNSFHSPHLGPRSGTAEWGSWGMNPLAALVGRNCSRRRDGGARILLAQRQGDQRIQDQDVPALCHELEAWLTARKPTTCEVDLSCNGLGDAAMAHFIGWLRRQPVTVQVFKVYKNRIGDMAVLELCELVANQKDVIEEVHISHNCITSSSIPTLLRTFADHHAYPRRHSDVECIASWVRLEHNWLDVSNPALEEFLSDPRIRCVSHTDKKALRVRKVKPLTRIVVYGLHWQEPEMARQAMRPRYLSADAPEFVPSAKNFGESPPMPEGILAS
jgi:hypothetical protein